jgi:hypothetical protein
VEVNIAKEQNPREAGVERMDEIASQLEGRNEHDAARRLRESSSRAKHKVETMNELMREQDTVPTVDE